MRQRTFGKSELRVSEVCLGTMAFGAGVERTEARRMLDAFFDAGGTFVDAASTFGGGEGESILGEAVRGRRDRVVIGTKFGPSADNRRANIERSLDESLARLAVEYVDVLWAYAWDPAAPLEELALAFEAVIRSGKARYVGMADAPAWTIARVHGLLEQRGIRIDGVILELGLAARDAERELLPMTDALDMTPLARGITSGDLVIGDRESVKKRQESSGDYYTRIRGDAAARIAPVLGPKNVSELHERLAAFDLELGATELAVLHACSRIDLGFPSEYLREIYGATGRSTP